MSRHPAGPAYGPYFGGMKKYKRRTSMPSMTCLCIFIDFFYYSCFMSHYMTVLEPRTSMRYCKA